MAEAAVILLSSDDSDAFVTPHPRVPTATEDFSPTGRGAATAATTTHTNSAATGAAMNNPESTPAARATAASRVAVIEIEDTPLPSAGDKRVRNLPARPGFLAFSSDDLSSSPFPGSVPVHRQLLKERPAANESPLREAVGENGKEDTVMPMSNDSFATVTERPSVRAARRLRLSDGEDDDILQPRSAKRRRLSPNAEGNGAPRFEFSMAGDQTRQIPPFPRRQSLALSMDSFDDELDDFLPLRQRQQNKSKANAECIDLLSSSDSEADRTGSTKAAPAADSDFADIEDLLMHSSPPPRVQQPKEARGGASGHSKQPSADIVLLSSSPLSPHVERFSSVSNPTLDRNWNNNITSRPEASYSGSRAAALGPTRIQSRRAMQRSLSEGHALAFVDDDDDEDGDDDGYGCYGASQNIDDLLSAWRKDCQPGQQGRHRPNTAGQAPARRRPSFDAVESGIGSRAKTQQTTDRSTMDDADKENRRKEKEAAREEKRKGKEAERERRQQEKEVEKERRKIASEIAKEKKAQERAEAAAFNNANRSRVDKAVAAPEMVVRLPTTLPQATKEVVETMLGEIKSSHETWTSPVDNVVTWRRKVTAEYKADLGHWVPVEQRIEEEKHALAVLRGEDFVQLIMASQDPDIRRQAGYDLNGHVEAMKRSFPDHAVIYLIEGLGAWKSKNRTIRNREFVAAVRNAGGGSAAAAAATPSQQQQARPSQRLGRRGQQQPPQHLDEAVVDDALLELQVEHESLLIHETHSSLDTARWIKIFTEQIATAPYRQQKEELYAAAASFCMDSGQIATGDGAAEMYTLMLQQIGRVTEPVALGVAARFDSVPKLIRGFAEEGPLALEACLKSRNRNGALSDRTVGQALSRRIYKVFMGQDEASTDV